MISYFIHVLVTLQMLIDPNVFVWFLCLKKKYRTLPEIESWVNYIRFVQPLSLKLALKYELVSYDFIR